MRNELNHSGLSPVGVGGIKCACCWPVGQTDAKKKMRKIMRRTAKKRANRIQLKFELEAE